MAFKTFYYSLWMLFILFAMVKGSCLEYGHSCWGAHGKRSGGNNKIYHTNIKSPTEVDFQDLNVLSEKSNYESNEEPTNGSNDNLTPSTHDATTKEMAKLFEPARLKKFLYKQLSKTGKQHNLEPAEHNYHKTSNEPMISERWRRLPIFNLRHVQITKPDNDDWLRELQGETQNYDEDYA